MKRTSNITSRAGGLRVFSPSFPWRAIAAPALFCALTIGAAGQTLTWSDEFGAPSSEDYAWTGDADGFGGAFIGGSTSGTLPGGGPFNGFYDGWLARYDAAGNRLWLQLVGTPGPDSLYDVMADGTGGVFAGGSTGEDLGGPNAGHNDAWLARYDSVGNLVWMQQFGSTEWDYVSEMAPDGAGGLFVMGSTEGDLGGVNAGRNDVWIARYDSAGTQLWLHQFGGGAIDRPGGMAPDGQGGVFLSGSTEGAFAGPNAGWDDIWFARYDAAGNRLWRRQFGSAERDYVRGAVPDGTGGVYLTGYVYFTGPQPATREIAWCGRYDAAGNEVWVREYNTGAPDASHAVFTDGSGGPSMLVTSPSFQGNGMTILRYDDAGNLRWTEELDTYGIIDALTAFSDGSGSFFVTGMTYTPATYRDIWFARFDDNHGSSNYCSPAAPNSTGLPASAHAAGANEAALNSLTLSATELPPNSVGYFIGSATTGFVQGAGGSQGNLCLGGSIGRFNAPGQIQDSGAFGSFLLEVDVTAIPQPTGMVAIQPGETWNFQAWYRDANPATTSNFTDAVAVSFQ